jgi:hypothetical protein
MLDPITILDVLESNFQSIQSHLGLQWAEFGHRGAKLTEQFQAIASEDDPESAVRAIEAEVNELLKICWDYPYVANLLVQAKKAGPKYESKRGWSRLHERPKEPDMVKIKETASRYYSLLAQLKKTPAEQTKKDANDRRTHT